MPIEDLASLKQEVFPENSAAGCFAACVFNKVGLVSNISSIFTCVNLYNTYCLRTNMLFVKNMWQLFPYLDKMS